MFQLKWGATEPPKKKIYTVCRGGSNGMGLGAVALQFTDFIRPYNKELIRTLSTQDHLQDLQDYLQDLQEHLQDLFQGGFNRI